MDGVVSLLIVDLLIYHLTFHQSYYPFMRTDKSGTILDKDRHNETTTEIVFAINQLYPSSINISPLTTIHRRILQHSPVRSIYLMMAGSLGFESINWNLLCFHSAYALLQVNNLPTHYAIGKELEQHAPFLQMYFVIHVLFHRTSVLLC